MNTWRHSVLVLCCLYHLFFWGRVEQKHTVDPTRPGGFFSVTFGRSLHLLELFLLVLVLCDGCTIVSLVWLHLGEMNTWCRDCDVCFLCTPFHRFQFQQQVIPHFTRAGQVIVFICPSHKLISMSCVNVQSPL